VRDFSLMNDTPDKDLLLTENSFLLRAGQGKARTDPREVGRAGSTGMRQTEGQDVKDRYQSIT
jgi:hypothetical protein